MTQRESRPIDPETLRTLRESLGLSQADAAIRTGYSAKTIRRWEAGKSSPRRAAIDSLRALIAQNDREKKAIRYRFVDLFAGIGGMRLGFEAAGGECVFTSEWNKYAQITYRTNFGGDHPIAGDIVQIPSEHIPTHDVLLAGFPCQPFSIAGVSKMNALGRPHGFACDTQGTLFFEVARILRHHMPRAFVLENVKNLQTHDSGRTFRTIIQTLKDELGYEVHFKVINAARVVPQHRERIFIVGFREPTSFSWDNVVLPEVSAGPKLSTILHAEDDTEQAESPYTDPDGRVGKRYTLSTHLWRYLRDYAAKHREKGNGFGFGLFGPDDIARTLSARYYKDGSEILIRRGRGNPRRLTPRECARLMGFDRPNRAPFKIAVSDTQAYKQFGNSVVVPVVEAVAKAVIDELLGVTETAPGQLALPFVRKTA